MLLGEGLCEWMVVGDVQACIMSGEEDRMCDELVVSCLDRLTMGLISILRRYVVP